MHIRISKEVEEAIKNHRPVVALESTIISHGMPYPKNVETAIKIEEIIRSFGVIPATIGIIEGVCIVGLSPTEIEDFGKRIGIVKVSRRDLPVVIAKKLWGATTVATTMILSNLAGIKIFVTGGIGGVHRDAQQTFDISADLQELANTDVAVICAGAKAILDLDLTMEYLETFGVPVLGYKTHILPSFYSKDSPLKVDYQIDSPKEFAQIMREKWSMGLKGGIIIANPIPNEFSLDATEIENVIQSSLITMKKKNIKGKDTTPFLLGEVKKLTDGKSLESNIALVLNNAKLGAMIALEYYRDESNE